ncbi:MAG: DUF6787 family protein [Cytophagales bacterium]
MDKLYQKLKEKWKVESDKQMAIIFIVFAITGSASTQVAKPLLSFLNIRAEDFNPFIYWPIRILIILPIYQVMLIVIGAIFGQYKFFWNFEKNMLNRMSGGLLFKEIKE